MKTISIITQNQFAICTSSSTDHLLYIWLLKIFLTARNALYLLYFAWAWGSVIEIKSLILCNLISVVRLTTGYLLCLLIHLSMNGPYVIRLLATQFTVKIRKSSSIANNIQVHAYCVLLNVISLIYLSIDK